MKFIEIAETGGTTRNAPWILFRRFDHQVTRRNELTSASSHPHQQWYEQHTAPLHSAYLEKPQQRKTLPFVSSAVDCAFQDVERNFDLLILFPAKSSAPSNLRISCLAAT